jgi:hypothetical protein
LPNRFTRARARAHNAREMAEYHDPSSANDSSPKDRTMSVTYKLENAVAANAKSPKTLKIPPAEVRETLRPEDFAKLVFRIYHGKRLHFERMWIKVQHVLPETYIGILANEPCCTDAIRADERVDFHSDHVIDVRRAPPSCKLPPADDSEALDF